MKIIEQIVQTLQKPEVIADHMKGSFEKSVKIFYRDPRFLEDDLDAKPIRYGLKTIIKEYYPFISEEEVKEVIKILTESGFTS